MKTKNPILYLSVLLSLFFVSCKKDKSGETQLPKKLYLLTEEEVNNSGRYAGKYYTDGIPGVFADGISFEARPFDMAVAGQDVFVLTWKWPVSTGTGDYGVYRNGTLVQSFPDSRDFFPVCITTKGNDYYVGGIMQNTTTGKQIVRYWHNGTFTNITPDTSIAYCSKLVFNGNDLYAAGASGVTDGGRTPAYWKNGSKVVLPLLPGQTRGEILDFTVSGSNVYATGKCGNKPCYWVNNTVTELVSPMNRGEANGILVSGSDVFVSGYIQNSSGYQAVYWKNGTRNELTTTMADAAAYDIALDGTDIYVAGYSSTDGNVYDAVYWKNGTAQTLTSGGNNGEVKKILFQ